MAHLPITREDLYAVLAYATRLSQIIAVLRYIDRRPGLPCHARRPFSAKRRLKFISVTAWGAQFPGVFNLCENCYKCSIFISPQAPHAGEDARAPRTYVLQSFRLHQPAGSACGQRYLRTQDIRASIIPHIAISSENAIAPRRELIIAVRSNDRCYHAD